MRGLLLGIMHVEPAVHRADLGAATRQFGGHRSNVDLVGSLHADRDLHAHVTVIEAERLEQHDRRVVQCVVHRAVDEAAAEAITENSNNSASEVEDAPVVKFLHKMLMDAFSMRASDLHFEPYEHTYRVRFRDRR